MQYVQAALKAAVAGLELVGDDAHEPPEGALRVNLMRHQAMALAWCGLLSPCPPPVAGPVSVLMSCGGYVLGGG
jgi:hypothetical protein